MPFDVTRHADTGLVTVKLYGKVEGSQILDALDTVDASVNPGERIPAFWDAREITLLAVRPSSLAKIVARTLQLGQKIGPGRTAIMTRRSLDGIMFRLVEVQLRRSPRVWKTFNREDEAMTWVLSGKPTETKATETNPTTA